MKRRTRVSRTGRKVETRGLQLHVVRDHHEAHDGSVPSPIDATDQCIEQGARIQEPKRGPERLQIHLDRDGHDRRCEAALQARHQFRNKALIGDLFVDVKGNRRWPQSPARSKVVGQTGSRNQERQKHAYHK